MYIKIIVSYNIFFAFVLTEDPEILFDDVTSQEESMTGQVCFRLWSTCRHCTFHYCYSFQGYNFSLTFIMAYD